ncbi:iron-containing alcohol dehydrogenase [Pseudonocardia ailaonensis]|uniref:Iron-containing alcohol dehydrogenase n=1 Tax=Pseudonocardia ailaonensis TaxID=367279 RepID=A0ABN2MIR0_9PSEU
MTAVLPRIGGDRFTPPGWNQVLFGTDARHRLGATVDRLGATRVVVLSSPSVVGGTPLVDDAVAALRTRHAGTFAGVRPHSPVEDVLEAAALARRVSADALLVVGGSSVVDVSKAVVLLLAHGFDSEERLLSLVAAPDTAAVPEASAAGGRTLPQIGITTTLAGSEFSGVAGITHASLGVKYLYTDPALFFDTVILDPFATLAVPREIWVSGGIKILDNAIEEIVSAGRQPVTTALALEALRTLPDALRESDRDPGDLDARARAQHAAWLTVFGAHNAWPGLGAALRHKLGARFGIVHGHASAILTPHLLEFLQPVTGRENILIAQALGAGDGAVAADAPRLYAALVAELGLPSRLRDIGIPQDSLPEIAADALLQFVAHRGPRPVSQPEALKILQRAW